MTISEEIKAGDRGIFLRGTWKGWRALVIHVSENGRWVYTDHEYKRRCRRRDIEKVKIQ